ncbi:HNH endonuclease [Vibrio phage D239]
MDSAKAKREREKKDLGMAPSTARDRLMRKLVFSHIQSRGILCYHCGEELQEDTFSIEHKVPWRGKEDAAELYFDLENVTYSHRKCNYTFTRKNGY